MKIAITGGIGSGKSTIIKALKDEMNDYKFYDFDHAVAAAYAEDEVRNFISQFGVATKHEMSRIAYGNPTILSALEKVTKPFVLKTLDEWLSSPSVVIEVPLLFEFGLESKFDLTINIGCIDQARIERIQRRNGLSKEKIKAMIARQMSQAERDKRADFKLQNDGIEEPAYLASLLHEGIIKYCSEVSVTKTRSSVNPSSEPLKNIGIVAGSFDPITKGHMWLIEKSLSLVEKIHVVIAANHAKKEFFSIAERVDLISESLREALTPQQISRISIDYLVPKNLLIGYARGVKSNFIFRGLRNTTDFDYENQINLVHRKIDPAIETIYLMPPPSMTEISSSLVKSLWNLEGGIDIITPYVSNAVLTAFKSKQK